MPTKNNFCLSIFSAYCSLKVHLQNFPKIKSQKESQNSRNQSFSYHFCMMTEGSGAGSVSGSIPLTNGSGSGRPKNMWIRWIRIRIRLRIRNTGFSFMFFICLDVGRQRAVVPEADASIRGHFVLIQPWIVRFNRSFFTSFLKWLCCYISVFAFLPFKPIVKVTKDILNLFNLLSYE
jgi:hypothetical protein